MTTRSEVWRRARWEGQEFQRELDPMECAHLGCPEIRDPQSALDMCQRHDEQTRAVPPRPERRPSRCPGRQGDLVKKNATGWCSGCAKRITSYPGFFDHTMRYIA